MEPNTIFFLIILVFSVILHELAHGSVANWLGDPTAKYAGRLTLNPLKHLDFFGSILVPFFLIILKSPILIGWAKPVPINPLNFRNVRWDSAKVALAGPLVNFCIALFFGWLVRFFVLPLPLIVFFSYIILLNLVLALFNLIPIPPLDGSHILFSLLPKRFHKVKIFLHQYGLFILIFFLLFGLNLIFFIVEKLFVLITNQPLAI